MARWWWVLPVYVTGLQRPDILLLIADDLGFNSVGYAADYTNVSSGFLTPRLDALAAEAVRLSAFYVLPLCAPTRAALLTGRYPIRYGLSAYNADWGKPWGLPANETLLPEVLRTAGYATGLHGKWHLGSHRNASLPRARGFDVFRGFYSGGLTHFGHDTGVYSYPPSATFPRGCDRCVTGYDFHDGATGPDFAANGTYSADAVEASAVAFSRTAKRPFYSHVAFQNVHEPLEVPQAFADLYDAALPPKERIYAGMVTALDAAAGRVVDALPALDETVVVFFSDNGAMASSTTPTGARANYFTGGKTLTTEGGVRVPCFIRYPPLLAPSGWHGGLFHVVDLFPTLAALAKGADHTNFDDLDGVDAVPQLLDARAPGRRREVLVNINPRADDRDQLKAPKAAIRRDDFKLSFEFWSNRSGVALYDLARDPMETADVADRHPLVVRALADRLEAHAANLAPPFEPWPPFQGADYACCDCEETFARGAPAVWTPWIPDDYEAAAPCAPPFAPCLVPPCYGH